MSYQTDDLDYLFDDWDGLRTCSVCGDRYTTSDVCWSCRQQEMIDNDTDYYPENSDGDTLDDADDGPDNDACSHVWQFIGNGCYQCEVCGEEECDD